MFRYQYLNFVLPEITYIYDFKYLKFSRSNAFNNAIITSPIIKLVYFYSFKFMSPQLPKQFLNHLILMGHSLSQNKVSADILPLYLGGGNDLFQVTVDTSFTFNFDIFFLQLLATHVAFVTEIYKILTLLNYYNISLR